MERLQPTELMGLTATPERADGVDVRSFFGGRTAAELRLWDALSGGLLTPFHYFGIADGTDLSAIKWSRGRYDLDALSTVYTGNDARAAIVLRSLRDKVADVGDMRALGFCGPRRTARVAAILIVFSRMRTFERRRSSGSRNLSVCRSRKSRHSTRSVARASSQANAGSRS